ncbi:fumarylacetoacetate hydrolase family protein [Aquabacterium sp. J223]|uniref:fumarylacetoacetate hydrolase family protein n=1 Tax=Aquabacterium sp. J223 TaxID=2898431 RepID=UPI0021AD9CBC|nr:fumarylacetoacetate hydrolase family protein [Aquabacterium sp. J223]UUX95347.1 fumarylacetoacetate hydrolase family protein [Aquabacterium sp. J223]
MSKYQLFTYRAADVSAAGVVVDSTWFDLARAGEVASAGAWSRLSVDGLIEQWTSAQPALRALVEQIRRAPADFAAAVLDEQGLTLESPLRRPGAVFGAGANYRDHVEAMSRALNMKLVLDPKAQGIPPWHFLKAGPANLSGHRGEVPMPPETRRLDWEAELAVVIGRRAHHVAVDAALDHVAGYMCANDLSARDHLVREAVDASSPFRYDWIGHKCFEGSCPLGPVFTPAEFVGSPEDLTIKLWVNGQLRQDSNTSNHLYGVAEQIAHLSRRQPLLPGDVILTGTPAGVGSEAGTFLQRGDVMTVEIQHLGQLETRIV